MGREHIHLTEAELLLLTDGELFGKSAARARKHLGSCWHCRERMRTLDETITGFVRERNREYGGQIGSEPGPRALLHMRLAQAASEKRRRWWNIRPVNARLAFGAGLLCATIAVLATLGSTGNAAGQRPNSRVTPGETRPITLDEVCSSSTAIAVVQNISDDRRREVMAAYGIRDGHGDYEIDYLITPDLGGADTIRNLWPQPYSPRWNARVKDRLEQRLHDLVCTGKIDLHTAQQEIASNWIRAYENYVGEPDR